MALVIWNRPTTVNRRLSSAFCLLFLCPRVCGSFRSGVQPPTGSRVPNPTNAPVPFCYNPPMLTLAISKGRVWDESLPLLSAMGCAPLPDAADSRRLIVPTENPELRLIVARSRDAPTFVASGAAQAGIVGRDILSEAAPENICQPLDLRVARCQMAVAVPRKNQGAEWPPKVVATKYPAVARAVFPAANIVKLNGSLELAPLVGLADAIVDLVETGKTLEQNGLVLKQTLMQCAAQFIVNRAAARRFRPQIADLQNRLAAVRPAK